MSDMTAIDPQACTVVGIDTSKSQLDVLIDYGDGRRREAFIVGQGDEGGRGGPATAALEVSHGFSC